MEIETPNPVFSEALQCQLNYQESSRPLYDGQSIQRKSHTGVALGCDERGGGGGSAAGPPFAPPGRGNETWSAISLARGANTQKKPKPEAWPGCPISC